MTRYDKTLHDYYAVSIVYSTDENGKRKGKPIYLHQFIMNAKDEKEWVDHINHNPRDKRKENLRFISGSNNSRNRKIEIIAQDIEMYVGKRKAEDGLYNYK